MNAQIDNQQHGHVVMNMIAQANPPFTRQALKQALADAFGPDVRFYTCSAQGLDFDGLMTFLADRGKVVEIDGLLTTDPGLMCDHE